jgi:predicted DNA-binding transcriptional regulator YafY
VTSARLLKLLTLLQTRREWGGAELAERLGVSTRTVRRLSATATASSSWR